MARRASDIERQRLARRMYLAGADVAAIAAEFGVKPGTVERWKAAGGWLMRRQARYSDPRGAAQTLRELLGHRVEVLVAAGTLDKEQADELAKIGGVITKLEGAGFDLKAAAVEVAERLATFALAREADEARKAWLADLLNAFFLHLQGEA